MYLNSYNRVYPFWIRMGEVKVWGEWRENMFALEKKRKKKEYVSAKALVVQWRCILHTHTQSTKQFRNIGWTAADVVIAALCVCLYKTFSF